MDVLKYYTELSKKQVLTRISEHTKQWNINNTTTSGMFFLSKMKKNRIYLLYSKRISRQQKWLDIVINEDDNKTILKCKFRTATVSKIVALYLIAFAWFGVIQSKNIAVIPFIIIFTIFVIVFTNTHYLLPFYQPENKPRREEWDFVENILEAKRKN